MLVGVDQHSQLPEQHGDDLSPTAEPARMPFGLVLPGRCVQSRSVKSAARTFCILYPKLSPPLIRKVLETSTYRDLIPLIPGGTQQRGANLDNCETNTYDDDLVNIALQYNREKIWFHSKLYASVKPERLKAKGCR